tara:strand:+ start:1040 stop:1447 length:408 start_codon:yes stop_codon:yes gene_type:complete
LAPGGKNRKKGPVTQNGTALQDASEELKSDIDIVLAAVTRSGRALEYASKELQKDPDVIKAAKGDHSPEAVASIVAIIKQRMLERSPKWKESIENSTKNIPQLAPVTYILKSFFSSPKDSSQPEEPNPTSTPKPK